MAPVTNARVLFNAIPKGTGFCVITHTLLTSAGRLDFPVPGETTVYDTKQKIDLAGVPLNGGFLIMTLPPFTLGEPIVGFGIGVVMRSDKPEVAAGKYVYGTIPHQQYSIIPDMKDLILIEKDPKLPWTVFVGAAGMPGKTAFMGWKEFSHAKKGETAFITAGAGPVGSMVIQLAKRSGLKVIASAGSDEKINFIKEIGADVVFNYKTMDTREVLEREGPIDIYWDNVGGDTLDAALEHANVYGRFIECGMISGYNTGQQGIKLKSVQNLNQTFSKSLTIYGLLVFRLQSKYDEEFYKVIPPALAAGELKYKEDVSTGLERVGDVILGVQKGENKGKTVVVVAEESV
ncbi:hypothetical protein DFH08DRAFT_1036187 [Mycena albidolilacea]|uniref:Enoyl reductase (ER) domain-containing protein n=1 Tax=Mycena albidolilacea TaxID=1033008 RepID=A0AAD6ZDX8_9AGAR|nr:hypothetical protein DFH08DRAFT_1036187 [Mycena albidolilacea]